MILIKKGQISLEFLIVVLAMVSILIIFMPVFVKLMNALLLTIDTYNASKYLQEFQTNVNTLNTLDSGSSFKFELDFIKTAKLICHNNIIKIELNHKNNKILERELSLNCDFDLEINKKISFLITKSEEYIVLN